MEPFNLLLDYALAYYDWSAAACQKAILLVVFPAEVTSSWHSMSLLSKLMYAGDFLSYSQNG